MCLDVHFKAISAERDPCRLWVAQLSFKRGLGWGSSLGSSFATGNTSLKPWALPSSLEWPQCSHQTPLPLSKSSGLVPSFYFSGIHFMTDQVLVISWTHNFQKLGRWVGLKTPCAPLCYFRDLNIFTMCYQWSLVSGYLGSHFLQMSPAT